MASMRRELIFQDDASNKFWTIDVAGSAFVTTHGRIGAKPRETRKEFADEGTALREAEKLVASKLRNGYREGSVASTPVQVKPDLASMAMSEETFWRIIALLCWSKTGDDDAVLEPAVKALAEMSIESICLFDDIMTEKLYALDTMAHAKNIGEYAWSGDDDFFSVDTFLYARCCVVANGANF